MMMFHIYDEYKFTKPQEVKESIKFIFPLS